MLKEIILLIVAITTLHVSAHEGHNDAPGALKANHGGVLKQGKEINLEYVVSGSDLKLYPINHEGKELQAGEVQLSVISRLPKGKAENIKIETKDGAFLAKIDFKNSYRIEMNVVADVKGKKSTFKFQVEK